MKLLFAGDVCPFDGYKVKFENSLKERFGTADFSFVNLECPLTDESSKIAKCGSNLKASPRQISVLKDIGVNGVTLANNHLLDYGGKAVMDTIRLCEQNGVRTVGAGKNLDAARRILVLEKNGVKVAILNVAEHEFSIAGKNSPGANPLDLINVMRDLYKAREMSERIILVVHGGLEHVPYPSPESVRLLRFLAEQKNVIAVIRHHPHIIQGNEMWNGVPIYYSLGNFYFPSRRASCDLWFEGLLVEVEVTESECQIKHRKVIMSRMPDMTTYRLSQAKECALPEVDTEQAEFVWREAVAERRYITQLFSPWTLWARIAHKFGLYRIIPPSRQRLLADYNIVCCEAHLECVRAAFCDAAFPDR